ncbi:MAG TPA: YcaO-like family protein [Acidimicrobiales bacterium]|nr:YcaO-like family protein [Acidimicrobiales bacterium]
MGLTAAWSPACRVRTPDGDVEGTVAAATARARATGELRSLRSRFGPVTQVGDLGPVRTGLPGHISSAQLLDTATLFRFLSRGSATPEAFGKRMRPGGKGLTRRRAETSALGEAAERLFGRLAPWAARGGFRYGTAGEVAAVGEDVLGPDDLPLFAPEQYALPGWQFDRFTDASFLGWSRATRLRSGRPVWVPAQLAWFGYRRVAGEAWLRLGNTGGMALGPTREDAVASAVEEVLERDSVNLSWHCGVPPSPLGLDVADLAGPLAGDLVAWQRRALGYDVRLYLHRWSTRYAVVSAVRTGGPAPARRLAVGAAAALDRRRAAVGALEELMQADTVFRLCDARPQWPISGKVDTIARRVGDDIAGSTSLFEALVHYGRVGEVDRVAPRMGGAGEPAGAADPGTPAAGLDGLLDELGLDPIVVDMSAGLRASGLRDLHLVRALIPELTLPNLVSWPTLGHPRYRYLPMELGHASRPLDYADLHTAEMPFG